jgi:hypothetical protein
MSNSYVVSHRANHDLKVISVTAREPNRSGCKVINEGGRLFLRWDWLNAKDRSDLNDWEIDFTGLTREEARNRKAALIQMYLELGYTIRTVKHYEKQ